MRGAKLEVPQYIQLESGRYRKTGKLFIPAAAEVFEEIGELKIKEMEFDMSALKVWKLLITADHGDNRVK